MAGAATFPSSRGRASPSVKSIDAVLLFAPEEVTVLLLVPEEVTRSLLAPEEVTISLLVEVDDPADPGALTPVANPGRGVALLLAPEEVMTSLLIPEVVTV